MSCVARLLLFGLLLVTAGAMAGPDAAKQAEARQLLELLGVLPLLDQTSNAVAYAVNAEREARGASAREASGWQRSVARRVNDRQLREAIIEQVTTTSEAAALRHAHALLEQSEARRVRYFEEAMGQRGAAANLREFLQAPPGRELSPERVELLREIGEASRFTEMVALLQTLAARAVRQEAGLLTETPPAAEEVALRQRWLQARLLPWQYYSYRYLKDDDLTAWLGVLRAPPVRHVLDAAVAALRGQIAALEAEQDGAQNSAPASGSG